MDDPGVPTGVGVPMLGIPERGALGNPAPPNPPPEGALPGEVHVERVTVAQSLTDEISHETQLVLGGKEQGKASEHSLSSFGQRTH